MRFYWLKIQQKSLSVAHFMPLKTKKTTGKETPFSVAIHNGVALPCVLFVLSGIVWSTQFES